jgi:hypothetical protein
MKINQKQEEVSAMMNRIVEMLFSRAFVAKNSFATRESHK